ncbi:ABC transporter ATP-binding protein [Spirochaetia bacterium]|nr:ABC transporter ATP-binding protein [Spirochaetia bacterium]
MHHLKWLWDNMGNKRPAFVVGLVIAGLSSAMLVINPMLSERLIDDVITPGNTGPLPGLLLTMFGVQIFRLSLRYLMVMLMEINSTQAMTDVRRRMFEVVQGQDYTFLNRIRTGNLMTRMTSDLDRLRHTLAWVLFQSVDSIVTFASAFIFLLLINWKLALCLVAVTPFILLVSRLFVVKIRSRFVLLRQKLTKLSTVVTENIDGNRVVKAFAREDFELAQFERHNADFRDTSVENALIAARYSPLLDGFSQLLTIVTLVVGGLFLIEGSLTAGQFMAFNSLTWALAGPLRMLGMLLSDLQAYYASGTMIQEVTNSKSSIVDKPDAAVISRRPAGAVEFRNVSFSVDDAPILKDISFSVKPGETVGILGSTGSGKTSLVNMLLRFYEPTQGEVLLDGVDIQQYTLSSLRHNIGLAMQDVFLFSESVKGNIAYGRPELDEATILKRAVQADADSFISKIPDKYETLVGERGVGLSGGQKQRISLARALAVTPSVLILDDTTSAVDSETEAYIQDQLRNLDFSCTKIIIAQRITSFRGANQILVMDGGRIVERGTHEELLANRGFYHHIWSLQNNANADAGRTPGTNSTGVN